MKTFEMSAYGVEEMNAQEIEAVNGGWWQVIVGVIGVVSGLITIYDSVFGGDTDATSGATKVYGYEHDATSGATKIDSLVVTH